MPETRSQGLTSGATPARARAAQGKIGRRNARDAAKADGSGEEAFTQAGLDAVEFARAH
jgi:hypothetical protein